MHTEKSFQLWQKTREPLAAVCKGGDGFDSQAYGVFDPATGEVTFDFPTFNDTTNVLYGNRLSPPSSGPSTYNGGFQQMSAYAQAYDALQWFQILGSAQLPPWTVTVNDDRACAACGGKGAMFFAPGGYAKGALFGGMFNFAPPAPKRS